MTVQEVAEELGLTRATVYNAIRAVSEIKGSPNPRRLHAVRVVGEGLRIHRDEVDRFRRDNVCPADLPDSGLVQADA